MKLPINRTLYWGMRTLSAICTPFHGTLIVFCVLFFFTYLATIPLGYRLVVLLLIYVFTILLPTFGLFLYRKLNGWHPITAFHKRERRYLPYIIIFICYIVCYYVMQYINLPRYMSGIIMGTAIATAASCLANIRWKIAEHLITMGGATAVILVFSHLIGYNPLWLLSAAILLSGLLGSARIILKRHTIAEVGLGFAIGFCSLFFTLAYYML